MDPLFDTIWNFFRDHSVTALTGAVGTFFGAWVALMFERWKTTRAAEAAKYGELLEAHMVLACHANSLFDEIGKLARFRPLPDREKRMPYIVHTFDQCSIDVRKLSFLLRGPSPGLVLDIHTVDMCYRSACAALEARNKMLEDFRSSTEVIHHNSATGLTGGIVDLPTLTLLRQATDACFECLDDAFASTINVMIEIVRTGKLMFPDAKFPQIEFPPLPHTPEPSHEPMNRGEQ